MKTEIVTHEWYSDSELEITLRFTPNWFEKLFGYRRWEITYIGSCTVWHIKPSFKRSNMEYELSNIYAMARHYKQQVVKVWKYPEL